jgi:hypothetical protein
VNLDERDLRAAYRCASEVLCSRRVIGAPIPDWLRKHHGRVEAWYLTLSALGHEIHPPASQSEEPDKAIDAKEAADMLRCSERTVRRRAADLDGQKLAGGQWVFSRTAVAEYVEEMRHA